VLKQNFIMLALVLFLDGAYAVETILDKPIGVAKGLVIIAPAKKYLMRERLFSELSQKLKVAGYATVRFSWSSDTFKTPDLELQRAARDINFVVKAAQHQLGFKPARTILISKSFSTKALDPSLSLAQMHILLTPNCSAEAPFRSTYAKILARTDILLRILISAEDPYCNVNEIRQTLKPLFKLGSLGVTPRGDHNFTLFNGTIPNYVYQDLVIRNILAQIELGLH